MPGMAASSAWKPAGPVKPKVAWPPLELIVAAGRCLKGDVVAGNSDTAWFELLPAPSVREAPHGKLFNTIDTTFHITLDRDGEIVGGPEESGAPEVALNPLDPCGACMEWLKKISEVNPDFKVLTFTSTNCEKVFITPLGDYG